MRIKIKYPLAAAVMGLLGSLFFSVPSKAGTVYESPYVTLSPDGKAFTTNAADKNYQWYEEGTTVDTGIQSSIRALKKGEHYYRNRKEGRVAVGSWEVVYKTGTCCHDSYPPVGVPYHDIIFGRSSCNASYFSGWSAYCADCGEVLTPMLIYMSKAAAATITELDMALDYYYLCPFCNNLEQGHGFGTHYCKAISWNRYQVRYDSNSSEWVGGYMENSFHMYNNETVYEGKEMTPADRLSKNTYTRLGYEFAGWNTKPDGSGTSYADRAQILNLTDENYDENGGGIVTLYAQWKRAESTLKIDPAGGSYQGSTKVTAIKGEYGASYRLKASDIVPPAGCKVSFQTQGGASIAPVTGTMTFAEWTLEQPFHGRFRDQSYYYLGENGSEDRITASYLRNAITLPEAVKQGSSFGGWFYDKECNLPAGAAGDRLIPEKDMVLYAKWVDLVLYSKDNYTANAGKGAVDLSWEQNDGRRKSYLVYQSRDQNSWTLVSDSADIGNLSQVNRSFSYSGKQQTYTVPYTGLYTITATGAQGSGYGSYKGGYGGRVSGNVWLEKGEKLIYSIGGQNGYNGGGIGSTFANGGGCTVVSSDRKGLLLTAGGGGGATMISDGGAGGSAAGNISTGINGESGPAGGGGGYKGGTAGQAIYHYHSDSCYVTQDTSYMVMSNADYLGTWAQEFGGLNYSFHVFGDNHTITKNIWGARAHGKGGDSSIYLGIGEYKEGGLSRYKLLPTNGNQTLNIHISADSWGAGGLKNASLTVYDQNNSVIYSKGLASVTRYADLNISDQSSINYFLAAFEQRTGGCKGSSSGWYSYYANVPNEYIDHSLLYWNEQVALPEQTTGVRIVAWSDFGGNSAWIQSRIHEISFSGSKTVRVCAYASNGQLVSSKQAYGGSSYVNTAYVSSYTQEAGKQSGNGFLEVQSQKIGYQDTLSLKGVTATDYAAPEQVPNDTVTKTAVGETDLRLEWTAPADRGTAYYHRVESSLSGSSVVLSRSNVTVNTLTTGVAGYYYLIDSNPLTTVNNINAKRTTVPKAGITLTADQQYFHVAAVDKAGNIGETTHIPIGRRDEEVAWPLCTDQLQIASLDGSVYAAAQSGTYYVKCDGSTPFLLSFGGRLLGQAAVSYQVNHLMFHMKLPDRDAVIMELIVPEAEVINNAAAAIEASDIARTLTGSPAIKDDSYTVIRRSDYCRLLTVEQRFTMEPSMNGRSLQVTPVAGADFEEELIVSDWETDKTHGLTLIGDNIPPDIAGTEALQQVMDQGLPDGKRSFVFEASDEGSGLKEFYAVILNSDNGSRYSVQGTGGRLEILLEDDNALFQGDFVIEFHAVDNVGNENVINCQGESFALTAFAERILEPHTPIFRGGESGRLDITAYGYPDRVEITFPKELTDLSWDLNYTYEYDGLVYKRQEQYIFMIPLKAPAGEYQITVTAWKDGSVRTRTPVIWILGEEESILEDIRTRLR